MGKGREQAGASEGLLGLLLPAALTALGPALVTAGAQ